MDDALATAPARLAALRLRLAEQGLGGLLVPQADEHGSEYLPPDAQRLRWLSGFTGSAATVVVLAERAALFTDGRYALQARHETDPAAFEVLQTPAHTPSAWLAGHAPAGAGIGFDPWLVTPAALRSLRAGLRADLHLVPLPGNPIDALWHDRPAPSLAPLRVHPTEHAGVTAADKRAALAAQLRAAGLHAAVITALDSVAWLLNVRGSDLPHNPVARAHAVLHDDGRVQLFVDARKLDAALRAHLGSGVQVADHDALLPTLRGWRDRAVLLDPTASAQAVFDALAGCRIVEAPDPCVLPRALKNDTEIAGARAAHRRDGIALTRFLHWLSRHGAGIDELQAAARLRAFRQDTGAWLDDSFPTISAAGSSAAMQHYTPRPGSARLLAPGTLYLVDSGAQYADGTTDVTRTVAIGAPAAMMRRRFTQALRGQIAIAGLRLPAGTTGGDLDALARQFLWQDGTDYASGTGHGVGSHLCVHEGPAFIGRRGGTRPVDVPLQARMVMSVEPGYYEDGAFGLRTENLYLVVDAAPGWLAFEPLTLAPIDRTLIDTAELSPAERRWIDAYHAQVQATLAPALDAAAADWLCAACRPLENP